MKIVLKRNGKVDAEYGLKEPSNFSVGRRGFNNQIELDDPTVSRNHAKITFSNGKVMVADLGSTNGTHWNNKRLPPNTPVILNEKDSLKFGNQNVYELLVLNETLEPQTRRQPVIETQTRIAAPAPETRATPVAHESDAFIPHFSGRKWGFINKEGSSIIPYKYEEVLFFKGDIAAVKQNGKYGLINGQDSFVVPPKFDEILFMRDCLISVSIDSPASSQSPKSGSAVDVRQRLANGLALAGFNGRFGFINRNGVETIPIMYDRKIDLSSGMAKAKITGSSPLQDVEGDELIPVSHFTNQYISEGMICAKIGQKWGIVDSNGQVRIPFQYEKTKFFQNGLAPVQLNGKWGFVDQRNNQVVPCQYEDALSFSEGLAAVKLNGRWGFADARGNQVIPCRFEDVSSFQKKFADHWRINADGILIMK